MPRKNKQTTHSMLQRILALERQLVVASKSPVARAVRNSKAGKRAERKANRAVSGISPVAARALKCITNPTAGMTLHWPGAARDSVKVVGRVRTSIMLNANSSALILPIPGVSSQVASYAVLQRDGGLVWESTSNLHTPTGLTGASYSFSEIPFTQDAVNDGMQVRCLTYHVKVKYVGPLTSRSGVVYFYENPEKDFLNADKATYTTALNTYMPGLLNTPMHTRRVAFTETPNVEHTFHPFLWKGGTATASNNSTATDEGWVMPQEFSEISYGQPAYPSSTTQEIYSPSVIFPAFTRAYAGNALVAIASDSAGTFNIEVTAHYEFAGGVARALATPTPSAPAEDVTHVKAAVLRAKARHNLDEGSHLQHLALDALKEVVGSKAAAAAEGVASAVVPRGTTAATIASGVASLFL